MLVMIVFAVFFYWTDGFSSSTASLATRSDSSKHTSEEAFDSVTELGTGSLPLRSQHAVAAWNDAPLTVFTDSASIYVAESDGTRHKVTRLEPGSGNPTLASHENLAVVAWTTQDAIVSSFSTDLIEWSEPTVVGVREQEGGPIPSIDWTGSEFAVVWVDAPKTNETTGAMDGVGTLQLATGDGVNTWTLASVNETAAMASISGSTLVWRDDRAETGSPFDTIRLMDIYEGEEIVICPGYDPAVMVDGNSIAIGYHLGAEAHLRTSSDGGARWNDTVLDTTGKFVAPMVSGNVFGAVWVDYTDAEAAKDARNDAGHRTSAVWNDESYFMNKGASYTLQGQGSVIEGQAVAVYQVDGVIFLAH